MDFFKQTRYFNHRTIQFLEEGITFSRGNLVSSNQVTIPYEEIFYEKPAREFKLDKVYMWICIFAGLTLVKLVLGYSENSNEPLYEGLLPLVSIFFVVFLITTLLSRRQMFYIPTYSSGVIDLYDNKPSEIELNEFLIELKFRTNNFLKKKYATIDKDLPTDRQLETITWLRQRNILDETEYESLKQQLVGGKNEVKGFKIS